MNDKRFDAIAIATDAARSLPRRSMLAGLGTGLASLALPALASAKKKRKKSGQDACKKQVDRCQTAIDAQCALALVPESCLRQLSPCCALLSSCDATAAYECLFAGSYF